MSKKKKKKINAYNTVKDSWINKRIKILKEKHCYNDEYATSTAIFEWDAMPKTDREKLVDEYLNLYR